MADLIFALIPLAIGLGAIALLNGWIEIRPDDPNFSANWRNQNRVSLLACSILSTGGGICGLLYASGIIQIPQG